MISPAQRRRIFPEADWQLCMLHVIRNTLHKVRRTDREALAQDLKTVYQAEAEEEAREALRKLQEHWGRICPPGCQPLGGQGLFVFGVPAPSQTDSQLLLHHKPAGTPGHGGETADEGGGGVLRERSSREATAPDVKLLKQALIKATIAGLCGNLDRKPSCGLGTMNKALCYVPKPVKLPT